MKFRGRIGLYFLKFCLYGKTGLFLSLHHHLEFSGPWAKYLDHENRAYKHEIWARNYNASLKLRKTSIDELT